MYWILAGLRSRVINFIKNKKKKTFFVVVLYVGSVETIFNIGHQAKVPMTGTGNNIIIIISGPRQCLLFPSLHISMRVG